MKFPVLLPHLHSFSQTSEAPLPCLRQLDSLAEGGDLWPEGQWKWVSAHGETPPELPHLPRCPYTTGVRAWNLKTREVM